MLAMHVPNTIRSVAPSSVASCTKASLPMTSFVHTALYPARSNLPTASRCRSAGGVLVNETGRQAPTGPNAWRAASTTVVSIAIPLVNASLVEVVAFVEVRNQPGVFGMPVQHFLGQGVRRRVVQSCEGSQKSEVAGLFGGNAGYRHIQMPADDAGDITER